MRKILPFLFILFFISCERDESNPFGIPSKKSPAGTDCSVNDFDGITSITNIQDISATVNWSVDGSGIGYGIFKQNGGRLELLADVGSSVSTYVATGLTAETDYKFLVRKLSVNATYDCNENYETARTLIQTTFSSCYELYNYHAGAIASGYYEIDTDLAGVNAPFDVYCQMDENSGGWTKVFYHDVTEGVFATTTDAAERNLNDPTARRYSILSKLESFRRSGNFEFWLSYPSVDGINGGNLWTQTSNPTVETPISGYNAIRIDHSSQDWGGIARSSNSSTYIDGSPASTNWWYAIGSRVTYGSATTVPGPGSNVNELILYVR